MKIEVVISVWDDYEFSVRRNISSSNTHTIREKFELEMDSIESFLAEKEKKRYEVADDDDIPF